MPDSQEGSKEPTDVALPARSRHQKPAPRSGLRRQPPYAVIVENDPEHTFEYMIETLQRVFGYRWLKAVWLTARIHVKGDAAVWTGPLETAEFKRERIRGMGPDYYAPQPVNFPLGVRLEPVLS